MCMIEIIKTFDFDAAHRLPFLPESHKCHRLHGHTYRVDIHVTGPADAHGIVIEYGELAAIVMPVIERLDHHYLNEIAGLENPTTEVLAPWIFNQLDAALPLMSAVTVWESATTRAIYRRQ